MQKSLFGNAKEPVWERETSSFKKLENIEYIIFLQALILKKLKIAHYIRCMEKVCLLLRP